jgi:preprotein translocase subunit Sec61beta
MTFLGVIFDSEKMTLEVTPDRVVEISLLVESWLKKKKIIFKTILQQPS